MPGNAHAELTHLVGRVDHIKLLDQLQGNKGNTKSGAGKLGITLWQHSWRVLVKQLTANHHCYISIPSDILILSSGGSFPTNKLKFVKSVSARRDKKEQTRVKKTTARRPTSFSNQ